MVVRGSLRRDPGSEISEMYPVQVGRVAGCRSSKSRAVSSRLTEIEKDKRGLGLNTF